MILKKMFSMLLWSKYTEVLKSNVYPIATDRPFRAFKMSCLHLLITYIFVVYLALNYVHTKNDMFSIYIPFIGCKKPHIKTK